MRVCYKCNINEKDTKLYSTFGKYICQECLDERRTGRKGHSGMIYTKEVDIENYYDEGLKNEFISLKRVKKSDKLFVKWFVEHYPQSKGIVGRQLNYLIYSYGKPIGIIGFASPPLNYKKFHKYFNLNEKQKPSENAKLFVNNNIFRIIHTKPNLGTQILKIARNTIPQEYEKQYKNKLLGIITFVEPPRTGALYKADNWDYLGLTQGVEVKRRGKDWTDKQYTKGKKKYIFGYKF